MSQIQIGRKENSDDKIKNLLKVKWSKISDNELPQPVKLDTIGSALQGSVL